MSPDRSYHIRPVLEGETLAAGLKILNAKLSWTDARRLIQNRHIHINGNLVLDETRRLKTGEVVKVFAHPRAPVPTDKDVRVLHVDPDLIVIDKPAGITTLRHAEEQSWDDRRRQRQPTLDEVVQRLVATLPRPANPKPPARKATENASGPGVIRRPGGSNSLRPATTGGVPKVRPVHRLDRDTSGLMLFALSAQAEPKLVQMFKEHSIRRVYRAVVLGIVREPVTLKSWFVRDRGDGLRGSSAAGETADGAQYAVTHVAPIQVIGDRYSLVECRLESGRTHQIRIHLAEAGHMLCGEKTYLCPRPGDQPVSDVSGAPRQALHSAELELTHPVNGQVLRFSSPLPRELVQWLATLES